MTKILIASTHNNHKLQEFREILGDFYHVKGLSEMGCNEEIEENGSTLEENSLIKTRWVEARFPGHDCFADDTGLEVEALDGAPGVFSARWAGPGCTPSQNVDKLLALMEGITDRRAKFRTVISLVYGGKEYIFEGEVKGSIATHRSGSEGFGYDPVFVPEGWNKTFAEALPEEKNAVSHRGRAIRKMVDFLLKNKTD